MKRHLTQLLLLIAFVTLLAGCATKPIRLSDIKRLDEFAKAIRGTWSAQDSSIPAGESSGKKVGNPYKLILADKGHCQRIIEEKTQDGLYHVLRSHRENCFFLIMLSFGEDRPGSVYSIGIPDKLNMMEIFKIKVNSEGNKTSHYMIHLEKDDGYPSYTP